MFSTGFKVKALGAAPAYARSARVVRCRGAVEDAKDAAKDAADSFAQDAKDSLKPRVEELRQDESEGTTSFERIMKFSGPGPELINGRLAMLGFFAAMSAEITSQETAVRQFLDAPQAVLGVSLLFIVASLIPIVRGTNLLDSGSGEGIRPGAFNVTNELINGRAAMVGLTIMLFQEALTNVATFAH